MPVEVLWYGGQRGSWCHGIVEWLTSGFTHRMTLKEVEGDGAIVVVKADWMKDKATVDKFHEETVRLKWLVLFVTANEEGLFSVANYERTGAFKKWLQTPHRHQAADHYLPWGWTPGCSSDIEAKKELDCSFAGQITHRRRWDMMAAFPEIAMAVRKWEFHGSDGFAKGISQSEYYAMIGRSKVVPCPSGPLTVDSFRVCEALQLGAIPVLDGASPRGPYREYWKRLFGDHHPLPVVEHWEDFPLTLEQLLEYWPMHWKRVSAFWQGWKAQLRVNLTKDLQELGAL